MPSKNPKAGRRISLRTMRLEAPVRQSGVEPMPRRLLIARQPLQAARG
jgi:hypothetical protein